MKIIDPTLHVYENDNSIAFVTNNKKYIVKNIDIISVMKLINNIKFNKEFIVDTSDKSYILLEKLGLVIEKSEEKKPEDLKLSLCILNSKDCEMFIKENIHSNLIFYSNKKDDSKYYLSCTDNSIYISKEVIPAFLNNKFEFNDYFYSYCSEILFQNINNIFNMIDDENIVKISIEYFNNNIGKVRYKNINSNNFESSFFLDKNFSQISLNENILFPYVFSSLKLRDICINSVGSSSKVMYQNILNYLKNTNYNYVLSPLSDNSIKKDLYSVSGYIKFLKLISGENIKYIKNESLYVSEDSIIQEKDQVGFLNEMFQQNRIKVPF